MAVVPSVVYVLFGQMGELADFCRRVDRRDDRVESEAGREKPESTIERFSRENSRERFSKNI
jgi:hypothetical protein